MRTTSLCLTALVLAGCASSRPAPTDAGPPIDPVVETRVAMIELGPRDSLARFFTAMRNQKPNRAFVSHVIGARAMTLPAPGSEATLAIWVRERCQYRIPFSAPPVETELPCVFTCEYPRDSKETDGALGCSFRTP